MLQSASTTRYEDRKRFKRYEPSYPIPGLFPASPCPHPENPRPDYYCGCRDCVSKGDQIVIDRSQAPPPMNPEDRALKRIEEYRKAIAGLQEKIDEQRAIIDEYAGQPTVYRPNPKLKGGK